MFLEETTKARIDYDAKDKFVPTKVFEDAKTKLLQQKIVIIRGNSGDGKTRTAVELLSFMWKGDIQDGSTGNQGYSKQPIQFYDLNDWDKLVEPNLNLCIFIDDMSIDLFKEIVRRQESVMALISGEIKEKSNCLVITLRNDVFKSLLSNIIFVEENLIDTSSDEYNIKEEKQQILDVYLPKDVKLSESEKLEIVKCAPNIGFPQCCRLYRDVPELQKQGVKFFQNPYLFMNSALSKLEYGRCVALLYLFLCGGEVLEKDLDPSNDKVDKKMLKEVFDVDLVKVKSMGKLSHKKKIKILHESLECLSGSLVTKQKMLWRKDDQYYIFSHDSVKDTVALLYNGATPIGFIQNCHCKYLCYITTCKNKTNKVIISPDNKYMYKRLWSELECKHSKNYKCLTSLDVWSDNRFVLGFFRWLDSEGINSKNVYLEWTTEDVDEYGLYHLTDGGDSSRDGRCRGDKYFPSFIVYVAQTHNLCLLDKLLEITPENHQQLQCAMFSGVRAGHIDVLDKIMERCAIPRVKAVRSQSSHGIYDINILHEACLFERVEMVKMLASKYPSLVHGTCFDIRNLSTLHVMVRTGNCSLYDIIETFVLNDFSSEERVQYLSKLVDCRGKTVLYYSFYIRNHSNTMVLHLLEKYPELISIRDKNDSHCLHWIAWKSNKELFTQVDSYLRKYYKDKEIDYDITTIVDKWGRSVLDVAKIGWGDKESKQDLCSYLSQFWS